MLIAALGFRVQGLRAKFAAAKNATYLLSAKGLGLISSQKSDH